MTIHTITSAPGPAPGPAIGGRARARPVAEADKQLATLKAEIGPGDSPEPPELTRSTRS